MPRSSNQNHPTTDTKTASRGIVARRIADLKLNSRNPRLHNAKQIRQIARSIQWFGFSVPILVDSNGGVIAGHGRLMACQLLGWTEVPTIALDHLSEAQAKAFMVVDNRLTENSTWDNHLLAEQLKELSELDFNLEAIGFDAAEINLRIENLSAAHDQQEDDPADLITAKPTDPQVSRPGDLFLLGRHRVYCGSAVEEDSYASLMQDQQAAMVFTDLPYNATPEGHVSGFDTVHRRDLEIGFGKINASPFTAFLTRACSLLGRYSDRVHSTSSPWIGGALGSFYPQANASMPNLRTFASG